MIPSLILNEADKSMHRPMTEDENENENDLKKTKKTNPFNFRPKNARGCPPIWSIYAVNRKWLVLVKILSSFTDRRSILDPIRV